MLFLSFAAVPLYKLFCQVTGYGGTPKIVNIEDEIKISINYSLERWRKAQNLSFRLGNEKLTLTEYDNVTLISIPYDGKLLLISTQPTVHYHDVIQSIISAIPPWEK